MNDTTAEFTVSHPYVHYYCSAFLHCSNTRDIPPGIIAFRIYWRFTIQKASVPTLLSVTGIAW